MDVPKKKTGLLLALGLGKSSLKKPVDDEPESDDGDESSDLDSAASSLIDALKADDVEGVKSALKLAFMSCQDD